MAVITPGTGSTITATTIEGQLWQLIHLIQNGERLSPDAERFRFTKDDTFIMSGNFIIPATFTRNNATGLFVDAASTYQPGGVAFSSGTSGTIVSTTLAQYFIDAVSYAVTWQNNVTKNPQNFKRITLNFSATELEYSGTIALPYTTILGAGGIIQETATEWLIT